MALIVWMGCNNNFQDHFMCNSWFVVGGRKPLEYVSVEKVWLIECLYLCTICASQNMHLSSAGLSIGQGGQSFYSLGTLHIQRVLFFATQLYMRWMSISTPVYSKIWQLIKTCSFIYEWKLLIWTIFSNTFLFHNIFKIFYGPHLHFQCL